MASESSTVVPGLSPTGYYPAAPVSEDLRRDGYRCGAPLEWGTGRFSKNFPEWAGLARSWDRLELDIITEKDRFITEISLSRPQQVIFLDDCRVRNCVSPIMAADDDRPGWRDALVFTFRPDRTFSSPAYKETHHG